MCRGAYSLVFVLLLSSCYLPGSQAAPEDEGIAISPELSEVEFEAPSTVDISDGFLPASEPWNVGMEETISLAPDVDVTEVDNEGSTIPSVLADIPVLSAEDIEEEEVVSGEFVLQETEEDEEEMPATVDDPETSDLMVNDEEEIFTADEEEAQPVELEDVNFVDEPILSTSAFGSQDVEEVDSEVFGEVDSEVFGPVVSATRDVQGEDEEEIEVEVEGSDAVGVPSFIDQVRGEGSDPREGVCTEQELDSVKNHFTTNDHECKAYQCVEDKTQAFFESLNLHYPDLWKEGGDSDAISTAASLLAACVCRCDMMKCEVDYMKKHASSNCFGATVEYCSAQNDLFVERCASAADEYMMATEEVAVDARWKSICPGSCSPSDPVDGLALPVSSGAKPSTLSSGEAEDTFEFSLESVGVSSGVWGNGGGISGLLVASLLGFWMLF